MSTFPAEPEAAPLEQAPLEQAPHVSIVLPCFNEEEHVLLEIKRIDQVVGLRTSEEGTLKIDRVPAKWFVRKLAERLTNADIPD